MRGFDSRAAIGPSGLRSTFWIGRRSARAKDRAAVAQWHTQCPDSIFKIV
jgi:hypothetical protein